MATTEKVIVQIHERTTLILMDADLQLREMGFISDLNTIRISDNAGAKHTVNLQDTTAPVFDNLVTFTGGLTSTGLITANGTLTVTGAQDALADFYSTDTTGYLRIRDSNDSLYVSSDNAVGSFGGNVGAHAGNLNIDLTNGRVGIGTISPTNPIDLTGSHSSAAAVVIDPDLTIPSGTTGGLLRVGVTGAHSITTEDNTITYSRIGSVDITEPKITKGASDTITNAFTLRVGNAPTEGTNNYALWVDSGASQFDDSITLGANADLIGSSTSDINMNSLFTVAGATGNTVVGGTLQLTDGSQDYEFSGGSNLRLRGLTTGVDSWTSLFSFDGDGTDNVYTTIYGVGTHDNTTNRERLLTGYFNNEFAIYSEANGTGTLRDLVLYTEGNTDQLKLDTDGSLSMSGSLNLAANADLIGSSTSDITINTDKFTVAGATGDTVVGGTLDVAGRGSFGLTGTDGTLHVLTASAGSVAADSGADDLVVENSTAGGISILTPAAAVSSLVFGSPSDATGASLTFDALNNIMRLSPQTTGCSVEIGVSNNGNGLFLAPGGLLGIGASANTSAILHLHSTSKAFIPPIMTTTQRNAISTPIAGMFIYNSTTSNLDFYNGSAWGAV